tara:strand:- start:570 stop:1064 length:495 start_codon:yes stop_codon:yes gene_type:complete
MAQRILGFVLFFVVIAMAYYWMVVDEDRTVRMDTLVDSDQELKDDYNATTEKYDRFDLRLIGHGKHLQSLQEETEAHYAKYAAKMDSIDIVFERTKLDMEQMEDRLTQKIDRLREQIMDLEDSFTSYKSTSNRKHNALKLAVDNNRNDINALDEKVNPKKDKKD